jgi:hypothetical protein
MYLNTVSIVTLSETKSHSITLDFYHPLSNIGIKYVTDLHVIKVLIVYILYPRRLSGCYGCGSATVEHCILLLRALSTNPVMKRTLCQQVNATNLIKMVHV